MRVIPHHSHNSCPHPREGFTWGGGGNCGGILAVLPTASARPQLTRHPYQSHSRSLQPRWAQPPARFLLRPGNSLEAGDKGSISSDGGCPLLSPLTFSYTALHGLPRSPLCLPFHARCNAGLCLRPNFLSQGAVFLPSPLSECAQLNTGSRGRWWPWLVSGHRS